MSPDRGPGRELGSPVTTVCTAGARRSLPPSQKRQAQHPDAEPQRRWPRGAPPSWQPQPPLLPPLVQMFGSAAVDRRAACARCATSPPEPPVSARARRTARSSGSACAARRTHRRARTPSVHCRSPGTAPAKSVDCGYAYSCAAGIFVGPPKRQAAIDAGSITCRRTLPSITHTSGVPSSACTTSGAAGKSGPSGYAFTTLSG